PMTWPQDSTIVQTMLKKYEHQKIETPPKKFDVRDYFANKKNKAQDEITRVRKQIAMYKYPTRSAFFKVMGEEQIKVFIGMVDAKIKACNQRINMLKNMQQSENISARIMDEQEKIDVMHNVPQMPQNFSDPVKPINQMVGLTNHVSLPPVLATNKHEEWINQLFR
ncbi:agamous-like MADS-box protein AGL16-like, partial [Trifolium medium]|nr:agamous-like MADS-box protein AGL16-like [Trifolium medium]